MGEFNNRHLNLITNSSIYDAMTILDLYTDIYINHSHIYSCSKSLKIKQKQNNIVC